MYSDKIRTFYINNQGINPDCIIEEFDDYIVIDNCLKNFDDFKNNLLKFPVDNSDEFITDLYNHNIISADLAKPPGYCQILPIQLFEQYIFEIYKFLVECEYLPQRVNDNLLDRGFPNKLSRCCIMTGQIFHNDMIINKNANSPMPATGSYYSTLFLDSDENSNNGLSLYNLIYNGERYSCLDDITRLTDKELVSEIADFLNVKHGVDKSLEKYTQYQDNDYFETTRFIPAKENRVVITKGGNWINHKYDSTEESYRINLALNEPPKQ
jgi:hypothetical protein